MKNQLGQLAPDAAALISRGDSLVYEKHKENPLLADYIQTHFQVTLLAIVDSRAYFFFLFIFVLFVIELFYEISCTLHNISGIRTNFAANGRW